MRLMLPQAPITILFAFALVGLATVNLPAQPQQPSESGDNDSPRITSVRVGIANHYKIGHWTSVRVEANGLAGLKRPRVEVTVVDSDGVPTTSSAEFAASDTNTPTRTAIAYTKVGRLGAPIRVVFMDGQTRIQETALQRNSRSASTLAPVELPAIGELLVALSSAPSGLQEAFGSRASSGPARRTVQLNDVGDLPIDWYGYDAVDVLVLSAGNGAICRQLAADNSRFAALVRWVELGGRLVILCGGEAAEAIADGGPLAGLVPGKLAETVGLADLGPWERFAEPAPAIPTVGRGAAPLRVPRLIDVDGHIEVYSGRRPTDLPLVIRAARGLGEVVFAGIDLTQSPLADWAGRKELLRALLRPYIISTAEPEESQSLVTRGYNDMSGALRQQLGQSFASVTPIAFWLVAVLAMLYLVVLGPVDFLLVHRWLRRPLAAWITFAVIVLLFAAGAMSLAEWQRGSGRPRANCLELVDVDTISRQVRGTYWASVYSPRARRLNLVLDASPISGISQSATQSLVSWWGLPGAGIGGMQARGTELPIVRDGYRYAADLQGLENVPVLTSATKSITARWTARADGSLLGGQLKDDDGLATGRIVNQTGHRLRNARLLYGSWGYKLGDLSPGETIEVGEQSEPRRVKTIVEGSALSAAASASAPAQGRTFAPDRASAWDLLNIMMFYDAGGGLDFARLPSRYQADCDLSRLLEPGMGRAILVTQVDGPASRLVEATSGRPLNGDGDFTATAYRFVLPVAKSSNEP